MLSSSGDRKQIQVLEEVSSHGADEETAGFRALLVGEAMTYLIIKAAVSGILVMIISEAARRSPGLGGLIASLPLVSLLGIIWLWRDTSDLERIASHAEATFWFVLPSLPMFLVFPMMLRHGIGFWVALALSCVLTMVLYLVTVWVLPKIGINI